LIVVQSQMKEENKNVSLSQLCRWFNISRSTFYYKPEKKKPLRIDRELERAIKGIIDDQPTWGVRFITAMIRRNYGAHNRKKIHRIIKINDWQVYKKKKGNRPRVKGWSSRATRSNERWAIDTTHILCGSDGWAHLTAVIDCCDRNIVGWRFSQSGSSKIASAALEDALRLRGIKNREDSNLILRSDNGLVFGAKEFSKVVREHKVDQEFITPYTPEQNGVIERFFRTLKEECVWGYNFKSVDDAFMKIADWIDKYHSYRPHSALGYLTPNEFRRCKLSA
jgi:putative transposase